ncbi:MAG: hypothetical protein FRX48_07757 [Lasallia pustulata]|uniref:Heme oxygenase-like, multi-helical n=1 Tax=Lasallia pustulata TaxID=136370 RepID=A0A5M8PH72_9LECA|nr:MAG: hypothetical protein FRX48_07757 [Lasallia pustulata]
MRPPAQQLQEQHCTEPATSLPEEINAATKQAHTRLNRLISARLPLALPPHSNDPNAYAVGLLHFAPVYIVFESVWLALLNAPTLGKQGKQTLSTEEERIHKILERLYIPELRRTEGLCQDLAKLLDLPPDQIKGGMSRRGWPRVSEFAAHIEASASAKPHVLVAYAWVMYMALFNGGRWMRSELSAAGDRFWGSPSHTLVDEQDEGGSDACLNFFRFKGSQDGDGIKHDFKARLSEMEVLLKAEERLDIVREAQDIFIHCALLVEELDDAVAGQRTMEPMPLHQLLLKHLLPMGMVDLFQGKPR